MRLLSQMKIRTTYALCRAEESRPRTFTRRPSEEQKEKQMGRIALSQHRARRVMQSPGPTDVPFKYRG